LLADAGYTAAFWPRENECDREEEQAIVEAARAANLVLAEVPVWSNVLHPDPAVARRKRERSMERLALADRVGAGCCVNVAGSRGSSWLGPHPEDLSEETFELVVESVRAIIDAVKPGRTYYALETMPWMHPDSPDSYRRLLDAVDRKRFAVHLDPANMITSPRRYAGNASFIRDCFAKLGPRIVSCHAKDVLMGTSLSVCIRQVAPGTGALDYRVYLQQLVSLNREVPLLLEELEEREYTPAAAFIKETERSLTSGGRNE